MDRLPSGDGGTVEHRALGEEILVHHRKIEGDVLPLAARIGEAEIDGLDLLLPYEFQNAAWICHVSPFDQPRVESAIGVAAPQKPIAKRPTRNLCFKRGPRLFCSSAAFRRDTARALLRPASHAKCPNIMCAPLRGPRR